LSTGPAVLNVREALTEMLKRDEARINEGKWRLIAPVERRKSASVTFHEMLKRIKAVL
jgi:hypothetical protein